MRTELRFCTGLGVKTSRGSAAAAFNSVVRSTESPVTRNKLVRVWNAPRDLRTDRLTESIDRSNCAGYRQKKRGSIVWSPRRFSGAAFPIRMP